MSQFTDVYVMANNGSSSWVLLFDSCWSQVMTTRWRCCWVSWKIVRQNDTHCYSTFHSEVYSQLSLTLITVYY